MKLLLDQDVYAVTTRYLRDLGHDVLTAADMAGSRAADETLLAMAQDAFVVVEPGRYRFRRLSPS